MKLKIWHKLALSIISIIAVVLVITMLLFQNSFKTGFLAYLNELDNKRINILERALVNDYQRFGSWNFLEVSPRAWRQYTHQAMQPPENKKPRRPPPRHRNQQRKPPPNSQKKLPGNPLEHFISVNPISKDTKKQNHLSLFSTSHQLIAGTQQDPKTVVKRPIKSDNKIIAYLYIKPFSQLKNELDQNFIDHQSQSFIKITLVALFLAWQTQQ